MSFCDCHQTPFKATARHIWHTARSVLCGLFMLAVLCFSPLISASSAQLASWRDSVDQFQVGVVVNDQRGSELARRDPFRRYLEDTLAIPVQLTGFADYNALLKAHQQGDIDYGIYSSSAFAIGQSLCDCIEPLAVASDGEQIGYYAVLLAQSNRQDLARLEDLEGAKVLLGRENSIAGSLLPKFAFSQDGITPQIEHQGKGMLVALEQLDDEGIDAVAAWSSLNGDPATGYHRGTLARLSADGVIDPDKIKLLWQSRLIPFGPHAVRQDLPQSLKLALLEALLELSGQPSAVMEAAAAPRKGPFRAVDAGIYTPLLRALQAQ